MRNSDLRHRIYQAVGPLPEVRAKDVPGTDLVCVFKKLTWGEIIPQLVVYAAPVPVEQPHGVVQVSKQQLDSYAKAVCDLTCVALVTWHGDQLRALPARQVRLDGSYPNLLQPTHFRSSLDELMAFHLRLSR